MIDNLTPYIKMTPPATEVAPPKMKMTPRSCSHLRFILLYQIRELDFADYVVHLGLHELYHHFDDVARRAELAVRAALGDLAEQVFVDIAHDVLVVEVKAIQCVYNLHQHAGGGHEKQRVLHIAGEGRVLSGVQFILDEGENAVGHVLEHGFRLEMAEFAPAAILVRAVENGIDNLHVEGRGVGFLAQLVVVENLNEHQIGDLLNDREGVGHAGRPEYVPNAVDFVFQLASDHVGSLLCAIDSLMKSGIHYSYSNYSQNLGVFQGSLRHGRI